jgi:hypothetical protein
MPALLVLFGFTVAGRADEPKPDLKEQVKQLVDQLADAEAAKQTAAVTALLKLGPAIVPFLPEQDPKLLTPDQLKHLQTIRTTLRDAQAQKELAPRHFTLANQSIPLSKALAELARQTGNAVMDRRQNNKDDVPVKLDLHDVTFWQALDAIAKEADARISLYEQDNQLALLDGPYRIMPVSYDGLFRTVLKRVQTVEDLEMDNHYCTATIEIAWEPRFQPLFLETKPDSLTVQDEKGLDLKGPEEGSGRAAINGRCAVVGEVRVEAPKRATGKLTIIKGNFFIMGPSKMLTFTFDNLAATTQDSSSKEGQGNSKDKQAQKNGKEKPEQKQTKEGVTVKIREFSLEPELWTIGISLEYPPENPEFESFESWLVNNKLQLEKKDGKATIMSNGGYEVDDQSGQQANLSYRFVEENDVVLGKPSDWKLVYKTPGTVLKVPVRFEFKEVRLP